MYRRAFLTFLAASLTMMPELAVADGAAVSLRLSAAQIEELLAGNTIVGTWGETAYRQYYFENGRTIYQPVGGRPDECRWRANAATGQYESWWEQTGWTPYSIVMTNDGFAWVRGNTHEPFRVLRGKQGNF